MNKKNTVNALNNAKCNNIKQNKKISKSNPVVEHIKLLSNGIGEFSYLRYFGEFLLFVDIKEDNSIETAGVTVTKTNPLLLYNKKFIKSLNKSSLSFILVHEVFHLLSGHVSRIESNNMDPELGNVAADMIINEAILNTILRQNTINKAKIINFCLRKPKKYTGKMILEDLYMWIKSQQKTYDDAMNKIQSQMQNQSQQNSDNNSGSEQTEKTKKEKERQLESKIGKDMKRLFDNMDAGKQVTVDKHMLGELPEDLKKEIIDSIETNLRNRGLEAGDITSSLKNLRKSRVDYTKKILSTLSRGLGTKNTKSFRRPNRRGIQGLKGFDSEFKSLNVLLDTSGSMNGYFEKALSFIFRNDISINLVQCDTQVHGNMKVKSLSDFKNLVIEGLGGTTLQPGIDFFEKGSKTKNNNLLILTDGYTDTLSFKSTKKVLILSNDSECPIGNHPRTKVEQIIIKDFNEN